MPLENLFPRFLTFLASITRVIPTHLFKLLIFKYSNLFAFYSILEKVIVFQAPKHYLIKTHDSESRGQEEAQQRDH